MEAVGERDETEDHRAPQVTRDQDRPASEPVHPDARRQTHQDERQELHGREQADLEGVRVEHRDRGERQGQERDLRPQLAHRIGGPELQEIRVAPQRSAGGAFGGHGVSPSRKSPRAAPASASASRRML